MGHNISSEAQEARDVTNDYIISHWSAHYSNLSKLLYVQATSRLYVRCVTCIIIAIVITNCKFYKVCSCVRYIAKCYLSKYNFKDIQRSLRLSTIIHPCCSTSNFVSTVPYLRIIFNMQVLCVICVRCTYLS